MLLTSGFRGIHRKYDRPSVDNTNNIFSDNKYEEYPIKLIPYDEDNVQIFDKYTREEATGYYYVHRWVDIQCGDQLIFLKNRYDDATKNEYTTNDIKTVAGTKEVWLYNRVEFIAVAIK